MTSAKQIEDTLDCGNPQETWQELVRHLKQRAASSRKIAFDYEQDAKDAAGQAVEHHEAAKQFDELAFALVNANVDFPKVEAKPLAKDEKKHA